MVNVISILGSTGSIGTQTLNVARHLGIKVSALTANSNIDLLEQQIREFKPAIAAVFDEKKAMQLKIAVADTNTKIYSGMEGLIAAATEENAQTVVTSVVGIIGLLPTVAAIKAKKNIALANKETLVTAGNVVTALAKQYGVSILPVDSEHSAIFQCLQGCNDKSEIKKIILTASGGSFFGKTIQELENVTPEFALNHPNWSMGKKITIDCATLVNKGLEFIEAYWLFDVLPSQIDIVIHRQSVIHSMVEFCDNSVIAQMGFPDMTIPIQYALTYPKRVKSTVKPLSFTDYNTLTFHKPDTKTFRLLPICMKSIEIGGSLPCAVNAANEVAVDLFLKGQIRFLEIFDIVEKIFNEHKTVLNPNLDDIINTDRFVREKLIKG